MVLRGGKGRDQAVAYGQERLRPWLGGASCAVPALCEKEGVFGPVSSDGRTDGSKFCIPHWTAHVHPLDGSRSYSVQKLR